MCGLRKGVRLLSKVQTDVGGLRAIELNYRPLRDIGTGRTVSYISRTNLNSPGLGVLMPETFRPAAEQSGKSRDLFSLELLQLAEAIRDMNAASRVFNWISVDMPLSILRDPTIAKVAEKVCDQFSITSNEICFTIGDKVLLEKEPFCAENIVRLRRHGFHIMMTGFGETSPYLRLSELEVDFIMFSPSVTDYIGKNDRTEQAVHSLIDFVNNQDMEPVADGVQNSSQAEKFYEFGCNHCCGPLSGDYISLDKLIE